MRSRSARSGRRNRVRESTAGERRDGHREAAVTACTTLAVDHGAVAQQKAMAAATSSGSSNRWSSCREMRGLGVRQAVEVRCGVEHSGVRVEPGETADAVTPVPTRSAASPFTSPTTPCLAMLYAARPNIPGGRRPTPPPRSGSRSGPGRRASPGTATAARDPDPAGVDVESVLLLRASPSPTAVDHRR